LHVNNGNNKVSQPFPRTINTHTNKQIDLVTRVMRCFEYMYLGFDTLDYFELITADNVHI